MAIKQLTAEETAYFCEQLASMLNSGMQLNDGLDILSEDIDDKRIRNVCEMLSKSIYNEKTLHEAMEESGVFPDYAINMVRIGTVSGRLEAVLHGLCEYYENRAATQRTLRSAVLHPLMLLIMMTVVIIVLVVQVIPMFADIFSRFDSRIGATVDQTVSSAYSMGMVLLIVLLVIVILSALMAVLIHLPSTRAKLESIFSSFPLIGRTIRRFSQSKLANAMSVMVASGISPEEALENAAKLVTERKLKGQIENCLKELFDGKSFADAVCDAQMFPPVYGRTLKIAYTAGSFDTAWKKISEKCTDSAEQTLANIISFIEPAIIIILAAMIGSILLTIMVPLMNIMSVLG